MSKGIKKGDVAERNVMLVPNSPCGCPIAQADAIGGLALLQRIVLTDYSHARITKKLSIEETPLPEDPAHIFWNAHLCQNLQGGPLLSGRMRMMNSRNSSCCRDSILVVIAARRSMSL